MSDMENMTEIQKQLFKLQDEKYRDFHSRLMPNIEKERVIGVRMPVLRQFAKELGKTGDLTDFLQELPHYYYEENNLHMLLITAKKDYEECLAEVKHFLPYIDNWATCDFGEPKCFRKHKKELLLEIKEWLRSKEIYTIRYGIGMLMRLFLDEDFSKEYLEWVAGIQSDEYYVNVMIAWYFATALAKQWDSAVVYLENNCLSGWVRRKTIQKAVESRRITNEQKCYLKTLK